MLTQIFYKKSMGLCFVGAGLLLLAGPVKAAYRVTDLKVSVVEGGASVTIEADAALSYSYFTIGEPEPRLVVDFSDAVHGLPKFRFGNLGTHLVSGIRTSQYRPYPHPSVRVVLDMPRLLPFQIKGDGSSLVILLEAVPDSILAVEEPVQMPAPAAIQAGAQAKVPSEEQHRVGEEPAMAPVSPQDSVSSLEVIPGPDQPEDTIGSRLFALGVREPVSYSSGGRRDPFVALPAGQEVEFGQAPLPNVEKLAIVGILLGTNGYRALAQDENQNGYVLREGDRVLYGYVVRIEEERVVFRLNRRGLDRTVILKLPQ